jgi:hypothetical protein
MAASSNKVCYWQLWRRLQDHLFKYLSGTITNLDTFKLALEKEKYEKGFSLFINNIDIVNVHSVVIIVVIVIVYCTVIIVVQT